MAGLQRTDMLKEKTNNSLGVWHNERRCLAVSFH